jgi:aryl-alcohol dehydrogenase-like predicted oxidoreductase
MHWPDTEGTPVEESIRAVDDLIKAGKVRWAGVSNFDVPLLERAMSVRHIDSLQPKFNLFDRSIESDILPYCREHGIGIVAYSPLASGLLGGRYTAETTFDPSDWRAGNPDFHGEGLRRNVQRVDRLKEIAARYGKTVAQLAIAWVLSTPGVTSAIVGVRRPGHLESALPAAGWTLDGALKDEIERCLTEVTATA